MTTEELQTLLRSLPPIGLSQMDDRAALHTRKDRKYLVSPGQLEAVLAEVADEIAVLEIDGRRWFDYESVYYDTAHLDSYHLAARRRRSRFKVRTRTYPTSGSTMVEVKTKDRRGRTVKHRVPYDESLGSPTGAARRFAKRFDAVEPYADDLVPVLTSRYRRATVVYLDSMVRATIDARFGATLVDGRVVTLPGELIVESKTTGRPSSLDRGLWRAGVRPVKISKYATGLAALRPDLPANRWHRVLDHLTPSTQAAPTAAR